ncbi:MULTISPECIES: hypothetical protein [unclassified Sphingopyxis]|uniref:hypothetical protein n=1 Tax=unclassified Sphingopyxis TaxID=2614943 RepID=UPI00073790EF|nr:MULTISPECIES: hypothetical protein [unclassified Sphingopyxis]KTE34051.1 hypothetical protein ATE62_16580 [Sphingopyxis sp. HIX]KTE74450.1 hypothetical protein ATE72_21620 [Sphingopyxis sp. HXXIV]
MRYPFALPILALLLAGCDGLPRDAAGTTERIERTHAVRVTVLPGTPDAHPALALLDAFAREHGARLTLVPIHGEHAHKALEDGEIDALVGHFAKTSPWQADIALSKPVARGEPDDKHHPVLRIARRNGENALILATDRLVAGSAR